MEKSLRQWGMMVAMVAVLASPTGARAAQEIPLGGGAVILGAGANYLILGAGSLNIEGATSAGGKAELRFGQKLWGIGPALGALANGDGEFYGYGGLYVDLSYRHLVLTPLLGVGIYCRGDGKDLGGPFEFREAATLAWQFDNRLRVGVQIAHISNAHIYRDNPGQQDLLLTVACPF